MSISQIGTWFKCDRCNDGIYKDGLPDDARERIHAAGWKTDKDTGKDYCLFCCNFAAMEMLKIAADTQRDEELSDEHGN